jgi:hypothetical protein
MGHEALPLACRQFPRQSLRDPRGVSITLSHYCPTAAGLLESSPAPLRIVDEAPGFPADGEYVGFTADFSLPPLLHPRLAMDWESWWAFESQAVALFEEDSDPLGRLALAVEFTRAWTTGRGALVSHVHEAFSRARSAVAPPRPVSAAHITESIQAAVDSVPSEWRAAALGALASSGDTPVTDRVQRRYVAAHVFANWAAHQGDGLRTWYRSVESAACLLSHTADPGHADLILRHLAEPGTLIRRWHQLEHVPVA